MITRIKAVRVQEIIMEGSANIIGNIRYNDILDQKPITLDQLPQARPLFNNFSHYPVVNEIVMIMAGPKDSYNEIGAIGTYYLPPINIFGSPHHNAFPNELTDNELKLLKETGEVSQRNYFQEIEKIRPLQPYSGDVMFEGRYGQSIRFGSTIKDSQQPNNWSNEGKIGNPITSIRNGQANDSTKMNFEHILEDANEDDSSIYLCSNQQISNFQKAGILPLSYKHMSNE